MKSQVPAWLGLPGGPSPPGADWEPGPLLRSAILGLAYAFVTLALTVNYAASVTYFLLAILGMYVGFRRGFVAGLTRVEKLVIVAFIVYPAVAILSYMLGTQTNVGFRFLGRDLRFLLFIPVYLSIRWARPRRELAGWAFAGCAVAALVLALVQNAASADAVPHGVAGTHIAFGDLALLSGFLGGTLLFAQVLRPGSSTRSQLVVAVVMPVAIVAGLGASVLSGAAGGWLAIPVFCVFFFWLLLGKWRVGWLLRSGAIILVFVIVAAVAWTTPFVHRQIREVVQNYSTYTLVSNERDVDATCVDREKFLRALLGRSEISGNGTVKIVRLSDAARLHISHFGCAGSYALLLQAGDDDKPLKLVLYRGNWPTSPGLQSAGVVAKGKARFRLGWHSPWVEINGHGLWRRYTSSNSSGWANPANLYVAPGEHVFVVPLQMAHGAYAFALAKTSLGQRLEMWRAAWNLFVENPWLGVGTGAFQARSRNAVSKSSLGAVVGHYEHAHSDYLTDLATEGIVGLLAYLALLGLPCFALTGFSHERKPSIRIAGLLVATGFGVFGLTETMFSHSFVIIWYALVVSVLMASSFGAGRQLASPRARNSERVE